MKLPVHLRLDGHLTACGLSISAPDWPKGHMFADRRQAEFVTCKDCVDSVEGEEDEPTPISDALRADRSWILSSQELTESREARRSVVREMAARAIAEVFAPKGVNESPGPKASKAGPN